ncbi:MAG TPA: hypothetical protein VFL19_01500, partial [Nitrospira sp.]|nr:hypothetical protein [Nitrospira sp.]
MGRLYSTMKHVLFGMALVVALPLIGILLSGRPLQPYLEFPPQTRVVQPAPFSWPVFIVLALLIMLTVGPVLLRIARARDSASKPRRRLRTFPGWGWLGAVLTITSWVLAWNRFPWFAALQ